MAHLIDKYALIAMIRNKVDSYKGDGIISIGVLKQHCEDFIISLDTLEVTEVQEESVSEELDEAADNALNNVLNAHEIVNIRSCLEMFKYGAQWKEKETLQDVKEKLLHMLNTSIDNKHFFEQLDDYIDALENK